MNFNSVLNSRNGIKVNVISYKEENVPESDRVQTFKMLKSKKFFELSKYDRFKIEDLKKFVLEPYNMKGVFSSVVINNYENSTKYGFRKLKESYIGQKIKESLVTYISQYEFKGTEEPVILIDHNGITLTFSIKDVSFNFNKGPKVFDKVDIGSVVKIINNKQNRLDKSLTYKVTDIDKEQDYCVIHHNDNNFKVYLKNVKNTSYKQTEKNFSDITKYNSPVLKRRKRSLIFEGLPSR